MKRTLETADYIFIACLLSAGAAYGAWMMDGGLGALVGVVSVAIGIWLAERF